MNALENLVDVRSLSLHEVFLKSIHYFVGRDLLRYYLLKIDNACITLNTKSEVATTQGSLGHRCHPWVFQAGLWWKQLRETWTFAHSSLVLNEVEHADLSDVPI